MPRWQSPHRTTAPFIVLTSNIFAILGLRAMYFVQAGIIATSVAPSLHRDGRERAKDRPVENQA